MTPRSERVWRRVILGSSALLALGAAGMSGKAVLLPERPEAPRLGAGAVTKGGSEAQLSKAELDALAARKLSKTIVKVVPPPPPPPPKPPAPPLDSIIRLSGITDYGGGAPLEAMIETKAQQQTRTYKVGEPIGQTGVTVLLIGENVEVSYDEKRWRLTFRGVEALPNAPVSGN